MHGTNICLAAEATEGHFVKSWVKFDFAHKLNNISTSKICRNVLFNILNIIYWIIIMFYKNIGTLHAFACPLIHDHIVFPEAKSDRLKKTFETKQRLNNYSTFGSWRKYCKSFKRMYIMKYHNFINFMHIDIHSYIDGNEINIHKLLIQLNYFFWFLHCHLPLQPWLMFYFYPY